MINGTDKGFRNGGELSPLTPARNEILKLLKKGLTNSQIAQRRKITERAVRKTKAWLEKNGHFGGGSKEVPKTGGLPQGGTSRRYRIHDFTISLPIHRATENYFKLLKSENRRRYDGHTIMLYPRRVVIHGRKGFGIDGIDADDAEAQADEFWTGFIVNRVEQRYGVLLLKHDCSFLFTFEIAHMDNGLAEEIGRRKQWIRVSRREGDPPWLEFDHSDSFEADTVDARSAGDDMARVVGPFFNDMERHVDRLRLPSQAWGMHDDLTEHVLRLAGELRELRSMQAEFVKVQVMVASAQKDLLQAQFPKPVGGGVDDAKNLREYTG